MGPTFADRVRAAQAELKAARALLSREISAYPPPYSACDQQYNHLLSERRRISGALRELTPEIHIPTPRAP